MTSFIRFQSAVPNRQGRFPGVFGLVNGLRSDSMLSTNDLAWVHTNNARMTASYADPSSVVVDCYDETVNPGARSWFRSTATELERLTREYLAVLDRYGIPWVELRTSSPGRMVYEDDVQAVAVPHNYAESWPFL